MKTRLALGLAVSLLLAPLAGRAENEIGFIEKFALAPDREAVLDQLVPGTEESYFFRALQYQNTGQKAKLTALLEQWAKRYPDSARRRVIENRAALLAYDADPQTTLKFLRDRLNLEFNHEPPARDQKPDLPTKLDPALISREAFQREALENEDNVAQVNDEALTELVRDRVPLSESQRRDLLRRIKRPDVPFLVDLIEADLKTKESRGFGEFEIHRAMLPEQLDELARRMPALYGNEQFVYARLRKLSPSADADAEFDPAEREAWLDRLWAYAKNLSGSFNSLKAEILLHRLEHDRAGGIYDRARFQEYLQLPRRSPYTNSDFLRRAELTSQAADLHANFWRGLGILPAVRSDEELVRDYLLHLLKDEATWEPWAAWLRDTWLKPIFAEAKIVNGVGDPEKWASLLSPGAFQALKERVDVDFSLANPPFTAPADDVSIDLFLKNTPKLIVKIYEINTLSFFLTNQRQLNTDLALDGLVANREVTHDFSADEAGRNPFRRTPRTFKFPELKGQRGAWVIEFIGGGKSSRALVRKGQWSLLQRVGAAGDMITVLDESRQPVKDAVVWLGGRKFTPDEKTGYILIPFTQQPGTSPIILADAAGTCATLADFMHHGEHYRLDAQFHIEREQLLARREATLAIRTALLLGDAQVSPELLQEPRLTLTSTTLDGIATTSEIKEVKLDPAKLFTYRFAVPERLASLRVTLSGKVENLSAGGTKQELSASRDFHLNGIDTTLATNDGRFTRFAERCVFELLGKNGEPVPDTAITFHVTHQDFKKQLTFSLSTDARGRIDLGPLKEIARVEAETPFDRRAWFYAARYRVGESSIQSPSGQPIRVPWMGDGPLRPGDVSLLERRADTFVQDRTAAIALVDGFLEIKSLPPGDYALFCRGNGRPMTDIHVVAGTVLRGWLNGATRQFEMAKAPPVHITSVKLDPDAVVVRVANLNPYVRVHVAATRFIPHGNLFESLGGFARFEGASASPARRPNLFAAGRAIGDEYRYILNRRYAKLFPGNMLPRPGLLLNPWEVRSTDLAAQSLAASEAQVRRPGDRSEKARPGRQLATPPPPPDGKGNGPDLDFLGESSVALYNLVPDADGVVRVDRHALGDHPFIQVYAEDLDSAELRSEQYPEMPMKLNDLRLVRNLDPQKPFTQKKEATVLTAGQTLTLEDVLAADLETYDSLARVFALLNTIQGNDALSNWDWLLQWPRLSEEEKRAKYSEFACHELNFFLSRKDDAFFQKVVRPYLRNKKDRTFLDDYLLGNDLHRYLEPWAFARLNAAERCLLAQHLPGESAAMARHERELWELLPPNPDRDDQLFETALRGRAMSTDDSSDFNAAKTKEKNASRERGFMPRIAGSAVEAVVAAPEPAAPVDGPPPAKPAVAALAGISTESATTARSLKDQAGNGRALDDALIDGAVSQALTAGNRSGNVAISSNAIDALLFPVAGEAQRQRAAVRQFFRALGPTKEWAENNYYQLPLAQQGADLITVNAFWRDYAAWDGKTPFVSANLTEAAHNFSEMVLALAVLDLPFESPKHTTRVDNGQFTLTAAGPLIAFHKEIKPATPAPEQTPLLVSQNFFRADDRYREEGNEKFDKYITEEFLAGVVYGANVVVTNPTSSPQKVSVLLQIPRGALPVKGSKATDSRRLQLEPYSAQTQEYYFYFPAPAAQPLPHYPVHVAREEQIVGEAKPFTFKVVQQLTQVDKTSWDYISQYGKDADVFAFLDTANLARLDLESVAWRGAEERGLFPEARGRDGKTARLQRADLSLRGAAQCGRAAGHVAAATRRFHRPVRAVSGFEAAQDRSHRATFLRAPGILAARQSARPSRGRGEPHSQSRVARAIPAPARYPRAQAHARRRGPDERGLLSLPPGPHRGSAGPFPHHRARGAAHAAAARLLSLLRGLLRGTAGRGARPRAAVRGLSGGPLAQALRRGGGTARRDRRQAARATR